MSEVDKELVQMRLLEREAQAYAAQLELLLETVRGSRMAVETVEAVPGLKDGDEFLVPIGGGVIMRTEWGHRSGLLADLGAGVVVDLGPVEIRDLIDGRVHQMEAAITRIEEHLRGLRAQLAALNDKVQEKYEGSTDVQGPP